MENKNNKIQALANFTEVKYSDVEILDDIFTVEGMEFYVLTDSESQELYEDMQRQLIDDIGIQGFTEYGKEYIINNCVNGQWFSDAMEESNQFYIDDIREEEPNNKEYNNRLAEEIKENNCNSEEEYLQLLNDNYNNGIDWYIDNFGMKEFSNIVEEKSLIDIEKVIEFCQEVDGRGHTISSYDGEENQETINNITYYIYRII